MLRLIALLLVTSIGCRHVSTKQPVKETTTQTKRGAVVSVSSDASKAGCQVLIRGGNAVDATIATAFALAVTFPEAGNIGGGGFMTIRTPAGEVVVIDYRETAPAAAKVDMLAGKFTQHQLVGVPGTVRGLALAHQRYGKRPWRELLAPAIALARDGFELNDDVAGSLNRALAKPRDEANEMRRVLSKPGGGTWQAGDQLIQPGLASTLIQIADRGPDAFYTGKIAHAIADTVKSGGGILTTSDLSNYRAKIREPIHGTFRGYDIYAPPPPSSGGIALVQMLNMLETFDLKQSGRYSPHTLHLMIETMRRAYADRARYLGDTDFIRIPSHLTTKTYARKLAATIDPNHVTPSSTLAGDIPIADESPETTHFSVLDAKGMAVSNTYTLEQGYGGRIMVPKFGFLLNNEMGDFNRRPNVTDRTGRIGTAPNRIAPSKRMLSSMTPVIVVKDGRVVMISGSPGGRTIINTMLCVLLNRLQFDMPPRATIDEPRMSHQWFPETTSMEKKLITEHADAIEPLRAMGHVISEKREQGDAHTIFIDESGTIHGVADPRRSGTSAGY